MNDDDDRELRSSAARRGESPERLLDRNLIELLQELRVVQTGVQILFAFLLTIPFAAGFDGATRVQRWTYVATLLLCAAASATLIAPVAYHRVLFRQGRREDLVRVSNRLALAGLLLLLLALSGTVFLVLDFVLGGAPAIALGVATGVGFVALWVVLPVTSRRRGRPGSAVTTRSTRRRA